MFEKITDDNERAQVGIGTLIVFIAMVLVAAIAAGVLINTAGVLQTQASDTGSETQEAVANQVEVTHASGNVSGTDKIDSVNLTIMKSAGSNAIDLESMTIQYTSDSVDRTLTHGGNDVGATNDVDYSSSTTDDLGVLNATQFATNNIAGDDGGDNELISTDDRVTVTLQVAAIEAGAEGDGSATPLSEGDIENLNEDGLEGGDSVTLTLTDQSGAEFTYGISVPSTFGNKRIVEV
ncbi:flagellin [Natrinema saccharevitans]|uniref:Flagellin n=1 Tax=Natrinema saccharevitans TaxID=301967 RepID=A0A1S8AST3_9EURY|nr:archaellin/type IV pilin N-terminal domain-containing protein [Natrinema saccharevitans]OLZ39732.1 flagellin [Natrinema saccharevitans]